MYKFFFRIFFFSVFLFFMPYGAFSLTQQDASRLQPILGSEHLLLEMYTQTNQGRNMVFGYHFDRFIWDPVYFSLAIFGAVGGTIGGYGMAGFGFGYRSYVTDFLVFDCTGLIGSGGGGGIAAGGGLLYEVLAGFSFYFSPSIAFDLKYGYLGFPRGDMVTPVIQAGVSLRNLFLVEK